MDLLLPFTKKPFIANKYPPQTNAYVLLNSLPTAASEMSRSDIAHVSQPWRSYRYPQLKDGAAPAFLEG